MKSIAFCSLATASHLPAALAALTSIRRFHADARFVLMTIGPVAASTATGIEFIAIEQAIEPATLKGMRARYSTGELCCAAKPYLIAHLLGQGAGQVHYLDSDIYAYSPLEPLVTQLAGADVLLTPHYLAPIPEDGHTPATLTVLRAGVFNAGYIGVRNTAEGQRFAQWFGDRTREQGRNAPAEGMCYDQRWLDLVPALFAGHAICRNPGANAAYWNLHERTLGRDSAGFTVNGAPLLFFHFSGWKAERPEQLSIHQNRHRVRDNAALAALLADYARLLPAPVKPSWWRLALPARG